MGLFDQILGAVTSQAGASGDASPLAGVMQFINDPETGGLAGLAQKFQSEGLAGVFQSWVSTGQNLPISAEQIQSVLGSDTVRNLASQFGVDPDQASAQLAEYLPMIVDQLTPNGSVPEGGGDLMSQGLGLLKGKLFG